MDRWTVDSMPDQTGRVAIVTGANAGLGFEVARALARRGAHVVLACRNLARGHGAAAAIEADSPAGRVEVEPLDLADLASVARFADAVGRRSDRLDVLVANAGLMAVDRGRTVDGFETQFGVNHLGHFALTARLLPLLTATPGSRVGVMSSMGHRAGRLDLDDPLYERRRYARWGAYFQSKLANLLFAAELQRRLQAAGSGTIAVAAHPGGSHTDLGTEGSGLSNRLMTRVVGPLTQSAAMGALPMLRAVTAPEVRGGEFWGPRWTAVGYPRRETPSRRARRSADAAALWDLSAALTRVEAPLSRRG